MNSSEKKISDNAGRKRIKPVTMNQQLSEMGKLPPQALDLEEAVLGALMLEKDALSNVVGVLKPEAFYSESHQRIFRAIQNIFSRSEPVDILTVTNELKKNGELDIAGGAFYIAQLTNRVASSANAEYHARIILEKHILRELIRISSETIKDAYEDTTDVFDLLNRSESNLFQVSEGNIRKNYDDLSALMHKAITELEERSKSQDKLTGVPSGFTELDRITNGWQRSDLIILAARPGMGKTAFVLNIARNAAVMGRQGVAVFTLEMASIQLVNRLISSETELSSEKMRKGNISTEEFNQLHSKIKELSEAPIFIDDTPALSIFELRAKARRLKAEKDIQMIIIDYLQLMTAGGDGKGNREQEISTISRSLKAIAKELNVPIIALSQLSRAVETRGGDKKPQLSDLRESGAIEQDADMVLFIYRPEYYKLDAAGDGQLPPDAAEIIIAKHRNGALGSAHLRFIDRLAKFTDLDKGYDGGGGAGGYNPSAGLAPSQDFGQGTITTTLTLQSRFNEDNDSFGKNDIEEAPF